MATAPQVIANLANAQVGAPSGSGPRTEARKRASSHNALKHGLTARTVLLPGEDGPPIASSAPAPQIFCDVQWCLSRCTSLETATLADFGFDFSFDQVEADIRRVNTLIRPTSPLARATSRDEAGSAPHLTRAEPRQNPSNPDTFPGFRPLKPRHRPEAPRVPGAENRLSGLES